MRLNQISIKFISKLSILSLCAMTLLSLNGCFFHYLVGDEARIQIDNRSESTLKSVWVEGPDSSLVVGPEIWDLAAGEKSKVVTFETLGRFTLFFALESDTISGPVQILGESYRVVLTEDNFEWLF